MLVYAPRGRVREAVQACRALRPLTRAAIVFASDDAVRSTDRIHLLEAGADDCLSGGIDFRELSLRIGQAIAAGSKPVPNGGPEAADSEVAPARNGSDGGQVSGDVFKDELTRRAADPGTTFFCVLDVRSGVLSSSDLQDILSRTIRADEGDLVTGDAEGCSVLLQGAREAQLGPFLDRLRARLVEGAGGAADPGLAIEVLSHPAESDRIRALLGLSSGSTD